MSVEEPFDESTAEVKPFEVANLAAEREEPTKRVASEDGAIHAANMQHVIKSNELDISDFFDISPANINHEIHWTFLTKHFRPDSEYKFPLTFSHGCNRSLSYRWLNENSFLVYSKRKNAVFCLPCILFSTAVKSSGFSTWHKIGEKLENHIKCGVRGPNSNARVGSMHSQNMSQAELF